MLVDWMVGQLDMKMVELTAVWKDGMLVELTASMKVVMRVWNLVEKKVQLMAEH